MYVLMNPLTGALQKDFNDKEHTKAVLESMTLSLCPIKRVVSVSNASKS